ncbi:MAG: hypothetical protein L0I76_22355 [Pseudonocardia sp.]|nr:hypothetical protein [Pseudonocardia sp.]
MIDLCSHVRATGGAEPPTGIDQTSGERVAARLARVPVITPVHRRAGSACSAAVRVRPGRPNSFVYAAPALRTEWGLRLGGERTTNRRLEVIEHGDAAR